MPPTGQSIPSDVSSLRAPRDASEALVLLKNFSYAADDGQIFRTDWAQVDSEFQNATIHLHCQTLFPAVLTMGISIGVFTSFDTVEANLIGSTITLLAPGVQSAAVTSSLGSMVRVEVANGEAFPVYAVFSLWLQLKSN